jgi:hypothetical protein
MKQETYNYLAFLQLAKPKEGRTESLFHSHPKKEKQKEETLVTT